MNETTNKQQKLQFLIVIVGTNKPNLDYVCLWCLASTYNDCSIYVHVWTSAWKCLCFLLSSSGIITWGELTFIILDTVHLNLPFNTKILFVRQTLFLWSSNPNTRADLISDWWPFCVNKFDTQTWINI